MEISINRLEHRYMEGTPFERRALHDINLDIADGTFLALIGHTGSGKSTLIQHLNGLLKPSAGSIKMGSTELKAGGKKQDLKSLRKKAGIVFQYPEHQLFEETVEKDIMFGPRNFGVSEETARLTAAKVIEMVGLPENVLTKSPFDLSGGQMRRVAIAGVLAMNPEVLILDEPTAGLDPAGRVEIMELFYSLHERNNLTTILVTHSMEDASRYADEIAVMHKGELYLHGKPTEIFSEREALQEAGLDVPETVQFLQKWNEKSGLHLTLTKFTVEELAKQVSQSLKKRGN
ncbi:energy-coupling factor ABC transporter ATP-binding protein [Fictibacillus phosphorivorans]|uniref:energy-coupling factor ABC transporter ATP-binding protein n=1 Tax=Fictibacillus phosphorivorans TaxID=1221500 RepID=UPI00129302DE|nr:energy-coupling factor ABC transporter ATP-binding protein [Fictibacillus phosphorivorans]MQR93732.1 energy-coupling factor ABC transporter ATP-binding protein [Fictibacillus phosphorivorans]